MDELAEMGGKVKKPTIYQHPNANQPLQPLIPVIKPVVINNQQPVPMEIDAISTRIDQKNPVPAICSVCIKNNLCFRCLQKFDPKTPLVNGERHCPNKNASLSEKLALISDPKFNEKKKDCIHQIAALTIEEDTNHQDAKDLAELGDEEQEAVEWLIEDYLSGRSDIVYPHKSDSLDVVEINLIRLMADSAYPRRVVVPMNLKSSSLSIQTMVFLDIGSMLNFVDDRFAKCHGLKLKKKEIPLLCEGCDG